MSLRKIELLLLAVLIIATLPLGLFLTDWAGLLLVYVSVSVLFLDSQVNKNWKLLLLMFVVLVARHVASLINVYYATLIGADMDAASFHDIAVVMAHSIQPTWFGEFGNMEAGSSTYTRFLSFFYRLFGESKFLGQELSILAYTCSLLTMVKLMRRLEIAKWRMGLVVMYGLLPSIVIFTSITMREAFQLLAFLLIIYWGVALREKASFSKAICVVLAGVGLGILHNGLVIYALFLVCFTFLWGLRFSFRGQQGKNLVLKLVGIVLLAGLLMAWFTVANDVGGAARALVAGEGTDYAGGYREKLSDVDRASYGGRLDTSSVTAFIPSAAWVFTLYMLAPFPWQMTSPVDFYAAGEGYLRLILMYQAFATWYRSRGERRSQWGFLIGCFFSLEFLWAMGTSNWGTAIRHHIVAYGVLVVLGGPGILRFFQRFSARLLIGRRIKTRRRLRLALTPTTTSRL